ncbi:UDP-N-acetylglucosamine 2-epimerase [Gallaecimonas xiamenensis]|uniref:UDP-N-acetylglucosamine 2-epimerase n=1 Tax=Gallaecimonas xiamenensis 3-C-1 TaxID=745411 RepID=K2JLX6_9GAMM|nr:UDP-N-acetylglucosamine 2-epimerase [Gallaecimonas xiamenensis]EKE75427.1 UDP-N-acetylglucosamine 2-epimerase [Gallaecimonas xiamenensis 3-C-1]
MRKIAVFTGTRAEYGLLYWVIKALHESDQAQLQLLVGGMHLSPEFGYTLTQIEQDGFAVTEKLEFLLSSDSPVGISKSTALALISTAEALDRHQPDLLVVLGDRFEAMAAAQAAMIARVPVAHLHGGEATEGVIDEAARHAITKMAHLHFTATDAYRQRVIQLGESPERVFNVGAPGLDSILTLPLLARESLPQAIGFNLDKPYFLVTYHPVTLSAGGASQSLDQLLAVLDEYPDHQLVISYPNADTHSRKLIELLEGYRARHPERVFLVQSLGQLRYLSLMKHCVAVLGNSSSGIIEAPSLGVPTVNIGIRQKGRIAGASVVHCADDKAAMAAAIKSVLSPAFQERCRHAKNPYGEGGASQKIVETLLAFPLQGILEKSFFDMDCH